MENNKKSDRENLRYNLITIFIYVVGVVFLMQLFNLQIIKGAEYRNQSNNRLTRITSISAVRGNITDRIGSSLATTEMGFILELYKTKIDVQTLNNMILNLTGVLNKNNDKYIDTFPINVEPFGFNISDEKITTWKNDNKINENSTVEEIFNIFREKYKIKNTDIQEIRKIIGIRYEIVKNGYSATKPLQISDNISRQTMSELVENSSEYPGIVPKESTIRKYPVGSSLAHVVGYISKISAEEYKTKKDKDYTINDKVGATGIEEMFEEYLKGKSGTKEVSTNIEGIVTGETVVKEAIAGKDIVLTIDTRLQLITEKALKNNIEKINSGGFPKTYKTSSGAAVVINVKTGEILSLVSYPTYDSTDFAAKFAEYKDSKDKPLMNRVIQGTYAPGSIFKMVTAIAGLETGAITATEKIVDKGVYPKGKHPRCWIYTDFGRTHGALNVSDAIMHSCNYFFYEVGDRIGIDALVKYGTYFGLGKKTGVELSGEKAGNLSSKEVATEKNNVWVPNDTYISAIGQSYNNFSPIQIAKYISILTNGGKQIDPTLVKSIVDVDGKEVNKDEIEKFVNEKLGITKEIPEDLNINPENIKVILEGMKSVTDDAGGTANAVFKNFNIEVGGKTGSTESDDLKINAWFTGFAPFNDPEIAVVVLVENGGHGWYTSEVARDIIAEYFGMNYSDVQESVTATPLSENIRL